MVNVRKHRTVKELNKAMKNEQNKEFVKQKQKIH